MHQTNHKVRVEGGLDNICSDQFLYPNLSNYGYKFQHPTNTCIYIHVDQRKTNMNIDRQVSHLYQNIQFHL